LTAWRPCASTSAPPALYGTPRRRLPKHGPHPERLLAGYRERYPAATPGELAARIIGDQLFGISAAKLCGAHAASGGRTRRYESSWRTPVLDASHAADIPFTFDTLGVGRRAWLIGEQPPQTLADRLHGAVVSSAKTGDPGWEPYEVPDRLTMIFREKCEVAAGPRGIERELSQPE
jgi:para-nitrobenzyl esterase